MKTELFSIRTSRVHISFGQGVVLILERSIFRKDKTMAALHPPNPEAVYAMFHRMLR